jgi:hypothetical protein
VRHDVGHFAVLAPFVTPCAQAGKGAPVKLEKQDYMGECRRECRTIVATCAKVKGRDMTWRWSGTARFQM